MAHRKDRDIWDLIVPHHPKLDLERDDPDAKLCARLAVDDPLYPVAAWAFHHGDELDVDVRKGLYAALEGAWPVAVGRKRTRRTARSMVGLLSEAGVPVDLIAKGLGRPEKEIKELRSEAARERPMRTARIIPVPEETEPYDPAEGEVGAVLARGPRSWSRTAQSPDVPLAMKLAVDLGFESLQDLCERGFSSATTDPGTS